MSVVLLSWGRCDMIIVFIVLVILISVLGFIIDEQSKKIRNLRHVLLRQQTYGRKMFKTIRDLRKTRTNLRQEVHHLIIERINLKRQIKELVIDNDGWKLVRNALLEETDQKSQTIESLRNELAQLNDLLDKNEIEHDRLVQENRDLRG